MIGKSLMTVVRITGAATRRVRLARADRGRHGHPGELQKIAPGLSPLPLW